MTAVNSLSQPATSGAPDSRPRWRDCPASVRELRARERALRGLHQLDRTLHAFWARLPLRELRIAGTAAFLGAAVYLIVVRRGSIEHSLSRLGSAQPGWIAVAAVAELASLVCYAVLVRVLLQLGAITVPLRALFAHRHRYRDDQLHTGRAGGLHDLLVRATEAILGQAVRRCLCAAGLEPGRYRDARAARRVWSRRRQSRVRLSSAVSGARGRGRHPHRSRPRSPAIRARRALGRPTSRGGPDAAPEQPVAANHLLLLLVLGFLNWLFDAAVLFAALRGNGPDRSRSGEWSSRTRSANSSPRSRFFRAAAARSKRP